MSLLQLVVFGITSLVLTFSLGYIILLAVTNLTLKECLALAGACGIAVQGAVAFIGFLLSLSGRTFFLLATLGLFTIAIALLLRRSVRNKSIGNHSWLYLLIVFWVSLLCIQLFVPIYSGAFWYGDWWMHYDIAQVYLGERGTDTVYFDSYPVTSRTPLFNLFSSYYLGLLENQFSTYQLSTILPGVFLLAALTLLIRPRQITLALILVAFNASINNNIIYPWPKALASLYIIASLYFYLDLRKSHRSFLGSQATVGCGISWGLAILSHQSSILYIAAMSADNIWIHRRRLSNGFKQLSVPLFIAVGLLLPWILWGIHEYSFTGFFLENNYYSLSPGSNTIAQRLIDTLRNAACTLVPYPLFSALSNFPEIYLKQTWNSWLRFYYNVLPGALTITMSCLLVSEAAKRCVRKSPLQSLFPDSLLLAVLFIGFFGGCFLQPGFNPAGIVGESMTPVILLLLLVATEYLLQLPIKLQQPILLMVAGEFAISRGLHLVALAMKHRVIWDNNIGLKVENNLVFARDLIKTPRLALMFTILAFLVLLAVGLRSSMVVGQKRLKI